MTKLLSALGAFLFLAISALSSNAIAPPALAAGAAAGSDCVRVTDPFEERVGDDGDLVKSVDVSFTVPEGGRVEIAGSCNGDDIELTGLALTFKLTEPSPKPVTELFGTSTCRGLRFPSTRLSQIRPAGAAVDYGATLDFVSERVHNRCDTSSEAVFLRVIGGGVVETCNGKPVTIDEGGVTDDNINGTPGDDVINAGAGNDNVDGAGGDDTICGGPGVDALEGGPGADYIDAGGGKDSADGGTGKDTILGGRGNDTLKGGGGARDSVSGEGGADKLAGGPGLGDRCDGGPGTDTLLPSPGCETTVGVP